MKKIFDTSRINFILNQNSHKFFANTNIFSTKEINSSNPYPQIPAKNPHTKKNFSLFSLRANKNFSILNKINLQGNIRIVEELEALEEIKKNAYEQLERSLMNEDYTEFEDRFRQLINKGISFSEDSVNNFLGLSYQNKDYSTTEILLGYISSNKMKLSSFGYCYVILSTLKFKGFEEAFSLFKEASTFGVPQNLTVIVSLIHACRKSTLGESEIKTNLNSIFEDLQKHYDEEVVRDMKLISKLDINKFDQNGNFLHREEKAIIEFKENSINQSENNQNINYSILNRRRSDKEQKNKNLENEQPKKKYDNENMRETENIYIEYNSIKDLSNTIVNKLEVFKNDNLNLEVDIDSIYEKKIKEEKNEVEEKRKITDDR